MTSPQNFLVEHNPFFSNIASDPWKFSTPDVSTIYENHFNEITNSLEIFRNNLSDTQALLILGGAGSGKTHLLGRFFTYCSVKEHIALCATVDPILNTTTPMQHLMREITISLDKKIGSSFGYSQFYLIVSRMIISYLVEIIGKTKKIEKVENDYLPLFSSKNGEKSIADQLAPYVIEWFLQEHAELDRDLITALFHCCNKECSLIAKKWLIGENLNPGELSALGFNHMCNLESTAHQNVTTLGNLLAVCHLPIVICFDTIRSLVEEEQKQAFSYMLDTVIFDCPSTFPIISSRPDVWENSTPYLTERSREIIEKYMFTLDYCSEEEAKNLMSEYVRSKLPHESDPALSKAILNYFISQIEGVDLIGLFPRNIINCGNRVISGGKETSNVKEVLAQTFERIYTEMREQNEENLIDSVRLNEALKIYFSAQSFPASMIAFKPAADLVMQADERWAVIIHTGSESEIENCFKAGIEYVRNNQDSHCLLFIDADNLEVNSNRWKTDPFIAEFELLGGHIFHFSPLERSRLYALHALYNQIIEGIAIDEGGSMRDITAGEFYTFLQDTELFPPFITIQSSLEELVHQMLAKGETKGLDEIIAELREQNWILSPESFMRWCIAQQKQYFISITRNELHFNESIMR
jgi:hypothetical protein